jgi:hypothetical protein
MRQDMSVMRYLIYYNIQQQNQQKPVERTNSGSSVSSFGLGLLSRTQSKNDPTSPIDLHPALTPQMSNPMDPSHLPLSRIVYKGKQIGLLPRASLDRKASTDEDGSSNGRRDSNNSDKSRSGSSGFSSTGFDIRSHKRQGPDGLEAQDR